MAAGRNIKGITIEIGGDTTKLQKALNDVNGQIRTTQAQLKDVDKLLKLDPGNTELLSQKYKTLQQEIQQTKEKLSTLKEASSQADQALKDGTISQGQYDALQREIAETEQSLKSLEQEYKNFGSVQAQQVAAAGEKMKEFGGKVEDVGKNMTTRVTLPLAAVGAAGVASFAEVDKTMQLTNKTMDNTEEEAQLLNKAMKDAAMNSTLGMSDAATAALDFARAGLDAEQAASALAPAMNLATGEGGNLKTVSAGLAATINSFHGSFEEAGDYADVFAAACNNSSLDIDSLSNAMSVAAPIFSAAGYKVNDAALYMGVMADNGIEADKAANSLKTGLARLVSPAKEGAEMMEKLGISVTNSDGSMKDTITIQRELHDAFNGLSESEQIAAASAIFGKNQMTPWLALINAAPADVNELSATLQSCAGTTNEMAESMMSGFGGSIEKLKSSLDVLVESIGEALAPTIQRLADFIQGLVDKFNSLTPAQQEIIVKIGLIVAAIGPVLIIIGSIISAIGTIMTIVPQITTAIGVVKGAILALNGVLLANPIFLIIAAIAALVAAFIYLWNHCEGFRNFWIGLWDAIKTAASTAWEAIKSFVQSAWQNISTVAGSIANTVNGIVTTITTGFNNAVGFIRNLIGQAFSWGHDLIMGIANGIRNAIGSVKNAVGSVASAIRSRLHFSVPDEGPLTDYESWMPDFMRGLAQGIEKSRGMVRDAIGHVAGDMQISPTVSSTAVMANAPAGANANNSAITAMLGQYLPYIKDFANMQMVTDTGLLVGALAPGMNQQLGVIAFRGKRQ